MKCDFGPGGSGSPGTGGGCYFWLLNSWKCGGEGRPGSERFGRKGWGGRVLARPHPSFLWDREEGTRVPYGLVGRTGQRSEQTRCASAGFRFLLLFSPFLFLTRLVA
jgi:hypothetical protein